MLVRVVLAVLLGANIGVTLAETPLPADINILVPAADVPPAVSAFSGKWTGQWADTLDHTLVVERVEGQTVAFVYSFGVAPTWGINSPGHLRATGVVADDGALRAKLPNGAELTYRMSSDQASLSGEYLFRGRLTKGTFKR